MALQTGTASGHIDLLNQLKVFLTTNSALVAAGQQWQVLRDDVSIGRVPFPYSRIAFGNTARGVASYSSTWSNAFPDGLPDPVPGDANLKWRLTGTLNIVTAGVYTFAVDCTGFAELVIDGVPAVSYFNSSSGAPAFNLTAHTATVSLAAGAHTFELRYFSATAWNATFAIRLGMALPGGAMSNFPTSMLTNPIHEFDRYVVQNPVTAADMDAMFADRHLCLKGTGLGGQDNIYINLYTTSLPANDYYNLNIQFATGYDQRLAVMSQPGTSGEMSALLWNQSIKYWFVANGRRFIVIAKINTVYEAIYGGLLLPYATPSEYPYPVMVGGTYNNGSTTRWSSQVTGHASFWNPGWSPALPGAVAGGSLLFRDADGNTVPVSNDITTGITNSPGIYGAPAETYPYFANPGMRSSPDGTYALTPVSLATITGRGGWLGVGAVYGELDGVYHVSGFNNSSESVITLGGENYLVVQSAFHTGLSDYAAIHMA